MDVFHFPVGVVALDVDAPTSYFLSGEGEGKMLSAVRALAREMSERFGLGRFWLYRTLSGMHMVFENVLPGGQPAVLEALIWANKRAGWHECGGHLSYAHDTGHVTLRVGLKEGRPCFDISVVPGNPPIEDAPEHVQSHHAAILAW